MKYIEGNFTTDALLGDLLEYESRGQCYNGNLETFPFDIQLSPYVKPVELQGATYVNAYNKKYGSSINVNNLQQQGVLPTRMNSGIYFLTLYPDTTENKLKVEYYRNLNNGDTLHGIINELYGATGSIFANKEYGSPGTTDRDWVFNIRGSFCMDHAVETKLQENLQKLIKMKFPSSVITVDQVSSLPVMTINDHQFTMDDLDNTLASIPVPPP